MSSWKANLSRSSRTRSRVEVIAAPIAASGRVVDRGLGTPRPQRGGSRANPEWNYRNSGPNRQRTEGKGAGRQTSSGPTARKLLAKRPSIPNQPIPVIDEHAVGLYT